MADLTRPSGEPTVDHATALERVAETLERRPTPEVRPGVEMPQTSPPLSGVATALPVVESRPLVEKTPLREDIEEVLADGLVEIYAALPPTVQAKFRSEGEQIAIRFEAMVTSGTVVVHSIYDAIIRWLRIIPSRSKAFAYFLIQEAKVKTDAILSLARRTRGG